jgi:hypothetical protein
MYSKRVNMKKIAYDGLTAYFILKVSIQHEKHSHLGIWSNSQIVAVFSHFILPYLCYCPVVAFVYEQSFYQEYFLFLLLCIAFKHKVIENIHAMIGYFIIWIKLKL